MNIKKILMPNKPHLDQIAALYLLSRYGGEQFSGINSAEIRFWEYGHSPSAEDIQNFENEGYLLIDIGGGVFDHHGTQENNQAETATELVAKYLQIDTEPELAAMLQYIREDDLEGLHNRYGELAYLIKCMHKRKVDHRRIIQFVFDILDVFQASQHEWHSVVRQEFEAKAKIIKAKRFTRKLKIGMMVSDNSQLANYGLTVAGLSVVVQKKESSNHVMILTNKHHKLDLREIISAIRKRELELRNYNKEIDITKLRYEGNSQLLPMWFYHRSLNAFLNGSEALAKTEETKLEFKEIVRFVIYGLSTDESELCDCAQGGATCPYRDYGFRTCQEKLERQF